MLFCSHNYLFRFLQKKITGLLLLLIFSTAGYAQQMLLPNDSSLARPINPLFISAYKKPVRVMALHIRPSPAYSKYVAKRGAELMHWPNYPLTTGQIIARNEAWQKRNNPNPGEQIASDIIKSNVNRLIFGRKMPPANIPRF